jgi:acyl-homoserine lactone acylase PvdQ
MTLRHALTALLLLAPLAASGQTAQDLTLDYDGTAVSIDRDDFGVPHITAATEAGVFFGQGFATAQDRLWQMETFWRTATGRLAELQGPDALDQDIQIRTVFYTEAERQALYEALSPRLQTMIASYVDGVNAYIDSMDAAPDPDIYTPFEYTQAQIVPEKWTPAKAMAVMQFFIRRFGGIGGDELARLGELQTEGLEWLNENRPINDPTAPTTIKGGAGSETDGARLGYAGPPVGPDVAARVAEDRAALTASLVRHGVPHTLGSFAAVIGSGMTESGDVLLLGAPQMGSPSVDAKAVTAEVELLVGEAGGDGLHVAGMTVPGIPGVIIGRTAGRAWTFTTGVTDNTDTFVLTLRPPTAEGVPTYLYDGEDRPLEVVTETIPVRGAPDQTYTHYRSVHGPVYELDAGAGQAFAWRYTFWERELEMAEALLDAWDAESVGAFEDAVSGVPVSFNIFYADKEQNIAFWHVGDYPVRPEGADPRLPLAGDGSQEWTGLVDFEDQPQAVNPAQGYFANWNNKPAAGWDQGDNVSWTDTPPGGRLRVYDGVLVLEDYLEAQAPVSFQELQGLARVVRTNSLYPEYPGTYQQVVQFSRFGSYAENVIPPGQSGFVNVAGVPSANFADQWALYQSSEAGEGPVQMKPFTFLGRTLVSTGSESPLPPFGIRAVYPNPSAGQATVAFAAEGEATVEVFDALGRRVAVLWDGPVAADATAGLDAGALPSGVYLVRLTAGERRQSRTFVIAR